LCTYHWQKISACTRKKKLPIKQRIWPLVRLELCRHLSHISHCFMILSLIVIMIMLRKQHIIMTRLFYPMVTRFKYSCSTPEFNSNYKYTCDHVSCFVISVSPKPKYFKDNKISRYDIHILTDVRSARTAMSEEQTLHAQEALFEASKCCEAGRTRSHCFPSGGLLHHP